MRGIIPTARSGRRPNHLGEILILAGALGAFAPAALPAQTVSPPIAEYQERGRAS